MNSFGAFWNNFQNKLAISLLMNVWLTLLSGTILGPEMLVICNINTVTSLYCGWLTFPVRVYSELLLCLLMNFPQRQLKKFANSFNIMLPKMLRLIASIYTYSYRFDNYEIDKYHNVFAFSKMWILYFQYQVVKHLTPYVRLLIGVIHKGHHKILPILPCYRQASSSIEH